jgi:hypothetical protein
MIMKRSGKEYDRRYRPPAATSTNAKAKAKAKPPAKPLVNPTAAPKSKSKSNGRQKLLKTP